MPRRIEVQVENDYLEQLAKSRPLLGIAELVWNAADAEAKHVRVKLITNDFDYIETIEVSDDGHGIAPADAGDAFSHLGGSWKLHTTHSKNRERLLHGRNGQGRFRAFSLGSFIRWITFAKFEGQTFETTITGTGSALREFTIDDSRTIEAETGTRVVIDNVPTEVSASLLADSAVDWLTKHFALWLERYPNLEIVYHQTRIDPAPYQVNREHYALAVSAIDEPIDLEVIEWNRDFGREMLLCDDQGIALWQTKTSIHAPGFFFTAYIKWSGFRRQEADLPLVDGDLNPFAGIIEKAHEQLRDHFNRRGAELRETVIQRWKTEQVYPFEGDPVTPLEQAERDIFDAVASTASEAVNAAEKKVGKRLSLSLLREAIEQRPSSVRRVLQEVLDLSDEKIEELDLLLQQTTLSALISLGKLVTDRLEMVEALHILLFEPETRRTLLERRQLHEILAAEPWLFGEEWALALSERQLTSVLREHLRILGRGDFVGEPVTLADGKAGRADMMFSVATEMPTPQRRHLVVELKRPSHELDLEDYTQVVKYADAVASDPRFDTVDVAWVFWLVGNEIERPLRGQINQEGLPPGLASRGASGRYEIWVKTWAELLNGCRHRLKFLRTELEYQSTDESAMATMRRLHGALLPDSAS